MKGRKPKPTALKVLTGTYRRDRTNGDEPKPKVGIPRMPADLDERARKVWRYYAQLLSRLRVLTLADRETLACFCVAAGRRMQAEEEIKKEGPIIKAPSGYPIQNPWLAITNKAMEQLLKWGTELGLSPASRTRVKVESNDIAADPMSKLLGRGKR